MGLTYFDVSAIVNPSDLEGVKELYPASEKEAKEKVSMSGCSLFPCATVYYHPDDVQTVTSRKQALAAHSFNEW